MVKESRRVSAQLVEVTVEFNQVKQKEKGLEKDKRELAMSMVEKEEETGKLVRQIGRLEEMKARLERENRELHDKLQKSELKVEDLQREEGASQLLSRKEAEVGELRRQMERKEQEKEGLWGRLEEALEWGEKRSGEEMEARDGLRQEIRAKTLEKQGLHERVEQLLKRVRAMKRETCDGQQEQARMRTEWDREREQFRKELYQWKLENEKLEQINKDLGNILEEETKKRLEYSARWERLERDAEKGRKRDQERVLEAQGRVAELETQVDELRDQVQQEKREKREGAQDARSAEERMEKYRAEWNQLKIQMEKLSLEKEELSDKCAGLERAEREEQLELEMARQAKADLAKKVEELNRECRRLENERYEAELELKSSRQQQDNLRQSEQTRSRESAQLEQANGMLRAENEQLRAQLEIQRENAVKRVQTAEARLERLEEELSEAKKQVVRLAQNEQELKDVIEEMRDESAGMGKEVLTLKKEKQSNLAQIEKLSKLKLEQDLKQHQVRMTARELETVQEKNRELAKRNEGLKQAKEELTRELLHTQEHFRAKLTGALETLRNEQREKNQLGIELREKHRELVYLESQQEVSGRSVRSFLANR